MSKCLHQASMCLTTFTDPYQKFVTLLLFNIFYLMKSDSFPRFKKDPLHERLERKLRARDFVNYRAPMQTRRRFNSLDTSKQRTDDSILTERDWLIILSGAETVTFKQVWGKNVVKCFLGWHHFEQGREVALFLQAQVRKSESYGWWITNVVDWR